MASRRAERPVPDTYCHSCGFRISQGVRVYLAGRYVYCQRCVRGPWPYAVDPKGDGRTVEAVEDVITVAVEAVISETLGDTLSSSSP